MANDKKVLFEFKYWTKYHFIALAVPLCCMATTYIQKYELAHYKKNLCKNINDTNCKIKEFPYFFNIFISKILSIFFVLFNKYVFRRKSSNNLIKIETKTKRRYHLDYNNKQRKIKAAFLILCISILELIFKIEGYLTIGKPNYLELKLGFLLLVPLLSLFILKKRLYRHHYFCFGICIIAFILVCISTHFYSEKPSAKNQLRHLCFSVPLGLAFVLIKYLYENSFVDAYKFLFLDGILCIIIPFITIGFISIFKGSDYFVDNMKGILLLFNDKIIIIYFFAVVICSFFYYLTNAVTIYLFNPSLMVMTDILSPIFRWVIEVFKDKEYSNKDNDFIFIAIFKGIGFVIIIFCSLVFNEILILHFCEFDKYIEANIAQRGELELRATNDTGSSSLTKDDDEYVSTTRTFESELSII